MAKPRIGVEIDTQEIRFAIKKRRGYRFASAELPANMAKGDHVSLQAVMAEFLRATRKKKKLPRGNYTLILSGSSCICRRMTMPYMTESQLLLNLPYEFKDYTQSMTADNYYDYAVESFARDEKGKITAMNILATLAPRKDVDAIVELFKTAHMNVNRVIPAEMAYTSVLRAPKALAEGAEKERCVVELGFESTRLLFFRGESLSAARIIPLGCSKIGVAIAEELDVDPYVANTYLATDYNNVRALPSACDVYTEIAIEVLKGVNFYRFNNRETQLEEIYFCGIGADISPLPATIAEQTKLAMRDFIELVPGNRLDMSFKRCAVACGAVME